MAVARHRTLQSIQSGLVLYLPMDENSGTICYDESGNLNNGTLVNNGYIPTWTNGRYGYALDFDGIGSVVSITDSPSIRGNNITLSAWVYPHSWHITSNKHVIRKGNSYFFVFLATTGKVWFRVTANSVTKNLYSTDAVSLNQFTHIVCTYDGSYMRIYINGILNCTPLAHTGNITYDGSLLYIGDFNINIGDGNDFDGLIDEVRVLNRALNQSEITELYNDGICTVTLGNLDSKLKSKSAYKEITDYLGLKDSLNDSYSSPFTKGSWCWYQRPKGFYFNGKTYIGWYDQTDKGIKIAYYDHLTKTWSSEVTVDTLNYFTDDHSSPAIFIDEDGYIFVFYADHTIFTPLYLKKSINSENITEWSERIMISNNENGKLISYPQPIKLANGNIIVFYRKTSPNNTYPRKYYYSISENDGETWSEEVLLVIFGETGCPYTIFIADDIQKATIIHVGAIWYENSTGKYNNLYHMYFDGTNWKKLDGTIITLPATYDTMEQIYTGYCDIYDIKLDLENNPRIVIIKMDGGGVITNYGFIYYNGSEWIETEIVSAGISIETLPAIKPYSSGIIIDFANPFVVYLCREDSGVWYLEKWEYIDSTWTKIVVLDTSPTKIFRPSSIYGGSHVPIKFFYQIGSYTDWYQLCSSLIKYSFGSEMSKYKFSIKSIIDYLGNLDILGKVKDTSISFVEYLGLKDSKSKIKEMFRTLTESMGLKDTKSKVSAKVKTITEILGLKDSETHVPIIISMGGDKIKEREKGYTPQVVYVEKHIALALMELGIITRYDTKMNLNGLSIIKLEEVLSLLKALNIILPSELQLFLSDLAFLLKKIEELTQTGLSIAQKEEIVKEINEISYIKQHIKKELSVEQLRLHKKSGLPIQLNTLKLVKEIEKQVHLAIPNVHILKQKQRLKYLKLLGLLDKLDEEE